MTDRNIATLDIDIVSTSDLVKMIQREDATIADAVATVSDRIAHAIDEIVERLRHDGRMFYVGAGTSGRIAMLDAAELPPTFGVSHDLVRVILAGGPSAFTSAVEGAEDSEEEAIRQIDAEVSANDAVVGVAASGTTPFTVAAVRRANMLGALTIGITSKSQSPLSREVDIPIVVETGPEVIMGSSRMKSGTAQKLVLNTLSTGVMIKLGHTYSNLMIDMPATNEKLRARAVSMVEIAAGVPRQKAVEALGAANGDVRLAVIIAAKNLPETEARVILERANRNLREILGR